MAWSCAGVRAGSVDAEAGAVGLEPLVATGSCSVMVLTVRVKPASGVAETAEVWVVIAPKEKEQSNEKQTRSWSCPHGANHDTTEDPAKPFLLASESIACSLCSSVFCVCDTFQPHQAKGKTVITT